MAEILKSVITCDRLPQRDCPAPIEADDVEGVLADIDTRSRRSHS